MSQELGRPLKRIVRRNAYANRVINHSLKWVNGKPEHNHIDGECVADFSCCVPELFTDSIEKRMDSHKKLLEKLDVTPNAVYSANNDG